MARVGEQKITTLEAARPAGVEPQQALLSIPDYLRKIGREINDALRQVRRAINSHDQNKTDELVTWLGK